LKFIKYTFYLSIFGCFFSCCFVGNESLCNHVLCLCLNGWERPHHLWPESSCLGPPDRPPSLLARAAHTLHLPNLPTHSKQLLAYPSSFPHPSHYLLILAYLELHRHPPRSQIFLTLPLLMIFLFQLKDIILRIWWILPFLVGVCLEGFQVLFVLGVFQMVRFVERIFRLCCRGWHRNKLFCSWRNRKRRSRSLILGLYQKAISPALSYQLQIFP